MGLVLVTGLLAGIIAGLVLSAVLVAGMVLLTRKHVSRRRHGWRIFGFGLTLLIPLLCLAVYSYPLPAVRPGSDYEIALRNFFVSGFAYAAVPGVAAVVVLVAVVALLRKNPPPPLS